MTIALRHEEENSPTNPVLFFASIRPGPAGDGSDDAEGAGFLVDPTALSYRLINPDGTELQASTAVDLVAERVGEGRHAPTFQIDDVGAGNGNPAAAAAADFRIEWTATIPINDLDTVQVVRTTTFRVVAAGTILPDAYVIVEDLRDEGVPTTAIFTDARLRRALELSARYIERATRRRFKPEFKEHNVDGRGGPILQLDEPIIAVERVAFTFTTFSPADLPIEQGDLRIYNRHIREDLRQPDDREDPRLEFLRVDGTRFSDVYGTDVNLNSPIRFARSQQNIAVRGLFGYTDYDGSPTGATPELIRWANLRLAMGYLRPLFRTAGSGTSVSGPISMERTRDQTIRYASASENEAIAGAFTGGHEVDQILSSYKKPPNFAAV